MRLSLGATRAQLVRQFLAESLVFSGAELPYNTCPFKLSSSARIGYVDGCVKYPDAHVENYNSLR